VIMNETELKEQLETIKDGMNLLDTMIHMDHKKERWYITEKQRQIVKSLFSLFKSLDWQIALNEHKEFQFTESDPVNTRRCGIPVKVRSCKKEHGDKTYFGILIGDVPLSLGATIEDNILFVSRQRYNPAIFVPELNDIVYGAASWWGEIEDEDELNDLITDDTIESVWYVKLLKKM
jgi:hypothetical protein